MLCVGAWEKREGTEVQSQGRANFELDCYAATQWALSMTRAKRLSEVRS